MLGEKFDRLLVVEKVYVEKNNRKRLSYLCKCDCGNEKVVLKENLVSGRQKSCGCLSVEKAIQTGKNSKKHGMWKTRVYGIWAQMKRRCQTVRNGAYERYGAKGITVCDRWQTFENFYEDMGDDNGLTLDRINPELGYSPDNCRWADWITQANNRRKPNRGNTT